MSAFGKKKIVLSVFLPILVLGWGIWSVLVRNGGDSNGSIATLDQSGEAARLATAEWRIFRGNAGLSGRVDEVLAEKPALLWSFFAGEAITASPVVDKGLVFFGSYNGTFYALDARSGEQRWIYETGSAIGASAVLVNDLVCFGTESGEFLALDVADGSKRWGFKVDDKILGSANVLKVADGQRLVFGCYDMFLYCLMPETGKLVWKYECENYINGAPAVYGGEVAVGGCDGKVRVIDGNSGKRRLVVEVGSYVAENVAVEGDFAFFGQFDGVAMKMDLRTGDILWKGGRREGEDGEPFFSPPALSSDFVLFGCRDQRLHCLRRDSGKTVWQFTSGGEIEGGALVCRNRVVVGSGDGRLYLLDLQTGRELWSYDLGAGTVSSPALAGGHLFIGNDAGYLFAFK